MALFNYATKEITLKIVFYGPGLSGKTTNLQYLHSILNPDSKGKLLSLATESDRTLFFDFMPFELGKIRDFSVRFQLYTVPGQVRYNATRKMVLKGADAVVFVADSQTAMREQNIESLENMFENLTSNNIAPDSIPIILQYNKRDLDNILSLEELNKDMNPDGRHTVIEAVAFKGTGVETTFNNVTRLLIKNIAQKHKINLQAPESSEKELLPGVSGEQSSSDSAPEKDFLGDGEINADALLDQLLNSAYALGGKSSEETEPASESIPTTVQPQHKESTWDFGSKEVPVFPYEEMYAIKVSINKLSEKISKLTDALGELKITVSAVKTDTDLLKADLDEVKKNKELKELRRDQKDMSSLLKSVMDLLRSMKEKKRWFGF